MARVNSGAAKPGSQTMMKNKVLKWVLRLGLCLTGTIYLLFLAASIYYAVVFPRTPQKVTLARAVAMEQNIPPASWFLNKILYISITDAVWDCSSVRQSGYKSIFSNRQRTDALFTDPAATALVLMQADGHFNCQDLQHYEPVGVLQPIDARPVEYQNGANEITIIAAGSDLLIYRLCTHCTRSNALLLPITTVLFPLLVWGYYRHETKRRGRHS